MFALHTLNQSIDLSLYFGGEDFVSNIIMAQYEFGFVDTEAPFLGARSFPLQGFEVEASARREDIIENHDLNLFDEESNSDFLNSIFPATATIDTMDPLLLAFESDGFSEPEWVFSEFASAANAFEELSLIDPDAFSDPAGTILLADTTADLPQTPVEFDGSLFGIPTGTFEIDSSGV